MLHIRARASGLVQGGKGEAPAWQDAVDRGEAERHDLARIAPLSPLNAADPGPQFMQGRRTRKGRPRRGCC